MDGTQEAPQASGEAGGGQTFDEPLHLLRPSEDHCSLVTNTAAMQRLEALGPVTVLSVVGNQRGGKSTLMNLLHSRRLRGFQTGHYMDPQTHGLWVWPKPHPRRPGLTVLLVDSEGLDSPHVPQHYNWLISAVTLLMSDVYMYQTKGSIEQSSAERLDMILKVAEQLGKAGGSGSQEGGAFLWLLRDHQLQMKNSPKQELIEKLDPAQVRALSRSFGDFDCVPLPRPAADSVLRSIDQYGWQDLDGDFQEEFVVLERRLLELLGRPRQLFGQDILGSGLAELLRQYTAAISQRKGALADICEMPTQRQMLQQLAGRRALEAGVKSYEERLTEAGLLGQGCRLPVRPAELLAGHEAASKAATTALEVEATAAGLEAEEVEVFRHQLRGRLERWDLRPELAAGGLALAGSEDEGHGEASSILEHGTCRRPTPTITKTSCLQGGLLFDLWKDNARISMSGYSRWLQRFSGLREGALKSFSSRAGEPKKAASALEAFYVELHEALGEAQRDEAGCLGPWAALTQGPNSGSELGHLLLSAAQQGDGLTLALSEASLAERAGVLEEQLSQQRQALAASEEQRAAEVRAGQEATAELREATVQAETRACSKAVEMAAASLEQGLQGLREEVREALRNLKASCSREIQERQAAQEKTAAEAAARAAESVQAVEQRAREASSTLREALEAQVARFREDAIELRRTVEAAEARAEARAAELQAGVERLQGREEESSRRCAAELSELRDRLGASSVRLEAAGASLESLRTSLDALQADLGGKLGELEGQVADFSVTQAVARELEEKFSKSSSRVQAQLARSASELEEQLARQRAVAEERHADSRAQADQLRSSLQALGSQCARELEVRGPRVEAHCQEAAEQLLCERLTRTLQECEVEEALRLELRLAPLSRELAALGEGARAAEEEQQRQAELLKSNDFPTLWESLAHLASRLTDIQEVVDNLSLKGAGLTGC